MHSHMNVKSRYGSEGFVRKVSTYLLTTTQYHTQNIAKTNSAPLTKETASSSEALVPPCQTLWYHIPHLSLKICSPEDR
jgi:hypothetical protein